MAAVKLRTSSQMQGNLHSILCTESQGPPHLAGGESQMLALSLIPNSDLTEDITEDNWEALASCQRHPRSQQKQDMSQSLEMIL